MTIEYLTKNKKNIAYSANSGGAFTLVFLGGFMSDMMGSKATHLEDWAKKNHYGFLRFDYSGHGQSTGDFLNLGIGDWFNDTKQIIELTDTKVVGLKNVTMNEPFFQGHFPGAPVMPLSLIHI